MRVVIFDFETRLIRAGVVAPELVCMQWETYDTDTGARSGQKIVRWDDALPYLKEWLADPSTMLVGHNVQFDLAVAMANLPELVVPIFCAVRDNRVTCTLWRQVLLDIACGCYRWGTDEATGERTARQYGLADCVKYARPGYWLSKGADTWRLRYGTLRDTPISEWPQEALDYALLDAKATLDVWLYQEDFNKAAIQGSGLDLLASQWHEMRGYLALQLASVWGLRTDATKVDLLEVDVHKEIEKVHAYLVDAKLVRADGSRDVKAAAAYMVDVCERNGQILAKTKPTKCKKTGGMKGGGNVALDTDACLRSGDPLLIKYARYMTLGTLLSKDVKLLRRGARFPIHPHFGAAETMRTTASPNVQNFARNVQ